MKELTKAEEGIMQVLWKLESAFVKEIVEELPEPKPAYNTVSTIVRILQDKGFVGYEAFGNTHKYHPIVDKRDYTKSLMKGVVQRYFSGSYQQMVSFFTAEEDLTIGELEQLIDQHKNQSS